VNEVPQSEHKTPLQPLASNDSHIDMVQFNQDSSLAILIKQNYFN
jgi:hypothetical protein